jgi:hypothetical protein
MYLTVSMRLTILAGTYIGSAELNALPTDCCRISSLRLTMCCCPTREALILGGGFRTVAGPLLFSTDAQRFPRPLHYVLLVYLFFSGDIRQNSL